MPADNPDLSPVKEATHKAWTQVLPDTPLFLSIQDDSFRGFRAHGTDFGVGLYDGCWVVAHVHAKGSGASVAYGPFDFYEQAIASLLSQVVGDRATRFLSTLEPGQE